MHTGKPDTGLAEWTQKIKALQRQVDADEEEEYRKLEQEIAASRLARVRRSSGYPSRAATADAVPSSDLAPAVVKRSESPIDDLLSIADRQREHDDALHKLSSPARALPSFAPKLQPARAEPVSLAAFIGGRATGPRLNKHAPQQDAHDPTQFEQRTRTSITTPHPVFGRGGVAMPGLAVKQPTPAREPSPAAPERVVEARPTSAYQPEKDIAPRERKTSTASRRYMEHVEQRSITAQKTGGMADTPRARTLSTPSRAEPTSRGVSPTIPSSHFKPELRSPVSPRAPSHDSRSKATSPLPGSRALATSPAPPIRSTPTSTPIRHAVSGYASSSSSSLASAATSASPASRPFTPKQVATPPATISLATFSSPGLARPIQPSPTAKSFVASPQPLVHSKSEAMLRTPQKDPTPSISRLKGRGFVQSIVKASSELEAKTSSPSVSETGRFSGKRLSSVADRWKPEPSPSPSAPQRKSWTPREPASKPSTPPLKHVDTQYTGKTSRSVPDSAKSWTSERRASPPAIVEPQHTGKSVRKVASHKSLSVVDTSVKGAANPPSPGGRGMGSSSTMISYIKPVKTGDDPATAHSHSRPVTPAAAAHSDYELGLRSSAGRSSFEAAAPAGKPLSHPTKTRAKKPKKAKGATVTFAVPHETKAASADERPPRENLREAVPQPARSHEAAAAPVAANPPPTPPPKAEDVINRWAHAAVIAVKPDHTPTPPAPSAIALPKPALDGLAGARPLPGFTAPAGPEPPRTPRRHSRIPSTGNRALVMDVAQVMQEQHLLSTTPEPVSPSPRDEAPTPVPTPPPPPVDEDDVRPQSSTSPAIANDRRKSSHEKYSAFVLPALKEEKTPVSSPAPTIARAAATPAVSALQPARNLSTEQVENAGSLEPPPTQHSDDLLEIPHEDEALPYVDLAKILATIPRRWTPNADILSISVDVMSVKGSAATALASNIHVFHESEVLAVVHRFKTKSTGLVATNVWGWQGKDSSFSESEEGKLKDLARRYGTTLVHIVQHRETPDFVHALGGLLAIRQGTRQHWSSDDTTMHRVHTLDATLIIDQCDLSIAYLCSAYSYCLTLLGTTYVWHGRGSTTLERDAALTYAQALAGPVSEVRVLEEGQSEDDELFWMMLGDKEYAQADYWRWRPEALLEGHKTRVWHVDASNADEPIKLRTFLPRRSEVNASVHIIDCIWELFVLVGRDARGLRRDIRLATLTASHMAQHFSAGRPFAPPVHFLILPSQIPSDLRLHFRDLHEDTLNELTTPDHMNLLTSAEGSDHLSMIHWRKDSLKDHTMLPLGLDPSQLV
ncbi:hypothetical protein FA95DRAFT_1675587 [Auriscalpium vulgare]|uniref:Uncharacterized protein n=1 Tax=Auriscalpium vulgare TaxID=40419 RepID=A0ACB8S7I9_9AGAM|nr:hypothetical protein FA95DRAFT_1675587 [Auriscalpium vulgare]